jgi:hypothetical protein
MDARQNLQKDFASFGGHGSPRHVRFFLNGIAWPSWPRLLGVAWAWCGQGRGVGAAWWLCLWVGRLQRVADTNTEDA